MARKQALYWALKPAGDLCIGLAPSCEGNRTLENHVTLGVGRCILVH
jgi:hypothetical protein